MLPPIQTFWQEANFRPNPAQKAAILHTDGPLFITAGPGSGKTRVLLWRTLHLIVYQGVKPEQIFLGTFTEKAALQLKEGLKGLLGMVTNATAQPFDIAKMYVGTIHALSQRILADRQLNQNHRLQKPPHLLDELETYFFVTKNENWAALLEAGDFAFSSLLEAQKAINDFFGGRQTSAKHNAASNLIGLFSRFSEEMIDPKAMLETLGDRDELAPFLKMYARFRGLLAADAQFDLSDFSLIQQKALAVVEANEKARRHFRHIIIDEYQDTNSIQEKLLFSLAEGSKNVCVVGDDDQALYRFRGATVENFVDFPDRCRAFLGTEPTKIALNTNYRSKRKIVGAYTDFIGAFDWAKPDQPDAFFRVHDKNIQAFSTDSNPSVIASTATAPLESCAEIARFVKKTIESGKVKDPNQIAFLYPALKNSEPVQRMIRALESEGIRVYAPRAGRFLEVEEAQLFFGAVLSILGTPEKGAFSSKDYDDYFGWMAACRAAIDAAAPKNSALRFYLDQKQKQVREAVADYQKFTAFCQKEGWALDQLFEPKKMRPAFSTFKNISPNAQKWANSLFLEKQANARLERPDPSKPPFSIHDVLVRYTSLDWNLLDFFYRLAAFEPFKTMYDAAENGSDEGPICNLGLISQYIAKFHDLYSQTMTAPFLSENRLQSALFVRFLYAIYRRGESEFENADDPFPRGRVPFLTIHQSKGLEFPVVVLGNLRKDDKGPSTVETAVRRLVKKDGAEPLERVARYDIARMFYVALSRAQNLVVLAHFKGPGQRVNAEFLPILERVPRIPDFDFERLPEAAPSGEQAPKTYSYTADFLTYDRCPRNYMVFRRYGLVPSKTQTMIFGNLVHRTIEDLHHFLLEKAQTDPNR